MLKMEDGVRHAIRRAVPGDHAAVVSLVQSAYEPWVPIVGGRPLPMDADYSDLIAAGTVSLAVSDGTGPVAGLAVLVAEDEHLLVENVAVSPALQGRGIGRQLLAFAEDEARRLDLPALRLYTNARMTRNVALYESLGYVHTGIRPVGDRGQIVLMRKPLS
jgi:ribosomal protein S18 acetylase RimI-like enzyme